MDHSLAIQSVLNAHPELSYAFLATASGEILIEIGTTDPLPWTDVIATTKLPESIQSFYKSVDDYEKQDPSLVPRLYGQGRTNGVIGKPVDGLLIAFFGGMPEDIESRSGRDRASWLYQFRNRVWASVKSEYDQSQTTTKRFTGPAKTTPDP